MIVSIGAGGNALTKAQRGKVWKLLNKMRWALDRAPRKAVRRYQIAIFWLEAYQ